MFLMSQGRFFLLPIHGVVRWLTTVRVVLSLWKRNISRCTAIFKRVWSHYILERVFASNCRDGRWKGFGGPEGYHPTAATINMAWIIVVNTARRNEAITPAMLYSVCFEDEALLVMPLIRFELLSLTFCISFYYIIQLFSHLFSSSCTYLALSTHLYTPNSSIQKNVLSKQIVSVKQIRKSRGKKKSECRRFASLAKRKRVNVECLEIYVVEILI